jgi:hypothetical protein
LIDLSLLNAIGCRKKEGKMLVVKKIKIEVTPSDAATLEFMQGKRRGLYNWWVMKLRNGESWPGTLIAKKTLK